MFIVINLLIFFLVLTMIEISQANLRFEVKEESKEGFYVGNIIEDSDLIRKYDKTVLSTLQFNFVSDKSKDGMQALFKLDENTGVIRTNRRIDREKECGNAEICTRTATVTVTPSQYFEILNVLIYIIDINDNKPYFKKPSINLFVPETAPLGFKVRLPNALDNDTAAYSVKQYELMTTTEKFKLELTEPANGMIWLNLVLEDILDREDISVYNFKLVAYDGGNPRLSGLLEILVEIEDSNDNSPIFLEDAYLVYIEENSKFNTTIITVKATDADVGSNGKITYSITDGDPLVQNLFDIEVNTGRIYVKNIVDFEVQTSYNLLIMALDGGTNSDPAFATVDIFIQDLNDNAQSISFNVLPPAIMPEILETTQIGHFIAHVSVSDPDSSTNGKFSCSLDTDKFTMEVLRAGQYKILTADKFDREKYSLIQFEISCRDYGEPPLTSTYKVEVNILDENDNAPVFSRDVYTIQVPENNSPGMKFLTQVNATDYDTGKNAVVQFKLEGEQSSFFKVDKRSGAIRAQLSLDYENCAKYMFNVVAKDSGQPPLSSTSSVIVLVVDENDEYPLFEQSSYSFNVKENQPIGTEIGTVFAKDNDISDAYNYFEFSLQPNFAAHLFSIDNISGKLRTKVSLDREKNSLYDLYAVATNVRATPLLSSTTKILITIEDENDNDPVLDFPSGSNFTMQISSHTPRDVEVGYLQAHDADLGENSKLFYQLIDPKMENIFRLHHSTGILISEVDLWNHVNRTIELNVFVLDEGNPPHSSKEHTLFIFINDSIPYVGSSHLTTDMISEHNIIIMIALVSCSSVIIIILLIAIILVIKKSRQVNNRRTSSPVYKMDELKNSEKKKNIYEKHKVHNGDIQTEVDFVSSNHVKNSNQKTESDAFSASYKQLNNGTQPGMYHQQSYPDTANETLKEVNHNHLKTPITKTNETDATSSDSGVSNTDSVHCFSEEDTHASTIGNTGQKLGYNIYPPQYQSLNQSSPPLPAVSSRVMPNNLNPVFAHQLGLTHSSEGIYDKNIDKKSYVSSTYNPNTSFTLPKSSRKYSYTSFQPQTIIQNNLSKRDSCDMDSPYHYNRHRTGTNQSMGTPNKLIYVPKNSIQT